MFSCSADVQTLDVVGGSDGDVAVPSAAQKDTVRRQQQQSST